MFKRNAIAISRVFYNLTDFWANEIFSVGAFIMLEIGDGWWEEFVRFFDPTAELRDSKIETRLDLAGH